MPMLHRFTLKRARDRDGWLLHDQTGGVVTTFATKDEALQGGMLEGLVGEGTVRIQKEDGTLRRSGHSPARAILVRPQAKLWIGKAR
jgi:hypothetical protein